MKKLLIITFLLISAFASQAQFSGRNIAEYQFGKLPSDKVNSFSGLYNRGLVNYSHNNFNIGTTIELFQSPYKDRNYLELTQYHVSYRNKGLELKVGNYYETIGRGLLLRSFEVPGAVLEDLSYRSRHYFHRDMRGFLSKYRYKNFSIKALYGGVLTNTYPPIISEKLRREDEVEAIYSDYSFKKQTVGISVMRLHQNSNEKYYGMASLTGIISPVVSYYVEVAKNISNYSLSNFSEQASYAIYANANFSFQNIGISAEYKKYNQFLLGSGINEPPALVKEHTYRLLNRSTHVLQPLNEEGYQIEAFITFKNSSVLTLNHTLAINDFGKKFTYQEYFAEYAFTIQDEHDIKLFADYADDPLKQEENRISVGVSSEWKINNRGFSLEFEYQQFKKANSTSQNQLLSVGYDFNHKFNMTLVAEISNDPFITDKSLESWFGGNFRYKINSKHKLQLFAGERRGGPACSAGVCYDVLDFKGAELRLTSRF